MKLIYFTVKKILRFSSVLLGLVLLANAGVYISTRAHIPGEIADLGSAHAVLIPGAAILPKGRLSPVFEARVEGALELYRAGKVSKILVSGDNSTVWYNEVSPVRDFLIFEGVPEGDIFLDHAGFDTYSSMYRAREIFGLDSVIVSTQSFHLPRAVFIGRSLGLEVSGYRTDGSGNLRLKNYLREIPANIKAILDIISCREPKYLGPEVPIPS